MTDNSAGVAAFDRLHAAVRYHVVNSLGWRALRPLQERALGPLLAGQHALLIAPTAGGKTEAAVLPVLSRMLTEGWRGTSVLYVCPIKALLNNLEPRLTFLAGLVGRRVGVWHGDVSQRAKSAVERDPPDILLTTPESLEGMLIGRNRSRRRVLGDIRCVIADELHAFAGDDRGWHLLALLERLQDLNAHMIQRIGLSATVGDPPALLAWFAGHARGACCVIEVLAPPTEVDLRVDYAGSVQNAALLVSRLYVGQKRLVFCDSRSKVEELATRLRELEVEVYVSHAALAADTRQQAERAFAERQNCVIVATSTLELGLDVGDLDRVIQLDATTSVASFLQRLGRTGRRAGTHRNLLFIATSQDALLEALAVVRLFRQGYVEPAAPPPSPFHVLVQQLFATLIAQGGELDEQAFLTRLRRVPGFAEVLGHAWTELREFLVHEGYVIPTGAYLALGPRGDRRFAGKALADLCVSFESPRTFAAMYGTKSIGSVDPLSLTSRNGAPRVILLGGRPWSVVSVDRARARLQVVPSDEHGRSRWLGPTRGVSRALSEAVRVIVESRGEVLDGVLTKRARAELDRLCDEMEGTLSRTPLAVDTDQYVWWTYRGLAANSILAGQIATAGGTLGAIASWCVRFRIDQWTLERAGGWSGIVTLKPLWKPATLPKFADLLPPDLISAMSLARTRCASAG